MCTHIDLILLFLDDCVWLVQRIQCSLPALSDHSQGVSPLLAAFVSLSTCIVQRAEIEAAGLLGRFSVDSKSTAALSWLWSEFVPKWLWQLSAMVDGSPSIACECTSIVKALWGLHARIRSVACGIRYFNTTGSCLLCFFSLIPIRSFLF
jgi:hypothetical protein